MGGRPSRVESHYYTHAQSSFTIIRMRSLGIRIFSTACSAGLFYSTMEGGKQVTTAKSQLYGVLVYAFLFAHTANGAIGESQLSC